MSELEKFEEKIDKFFKDTPKEEIDKIIAEVDAMHIEGPTLDEYFDGLQKHLSEWQRNIGNNPRK
jgi:hypothetical protein